MRLILEVWWYLLYQQPPMGEMGLLSYNTVDSWYITLFIACNTRTNKCNTVAKFSTPKDIPSSYFLSVLNDAQLRWWLFTIYEAYPVPCIFRVVIPGVDFSRHSQFSRQLKQHEEVGLLFLVLPVYQSVTKEPIWKMHRFQFNITVTS